MIDEEFCRGISLMKASGVSVNSTAALHLRIDKRRWIPDKTAKIPPSDISCGFLFVERSIFPFIKRKYNEQYTWNVVVPVRKLWHLLFNARALCYRSVRVGMHHHEAPNAFTYN